MSKRLSARQIAQAPSDDVIAGLAATRKSLPCRLLYDSRGAELFERICELDDYYLTRSELALLAEHLPAIGTLAGPHVRVVEPGSGAGEKTRMLLTALDRPASYAPIDVSRDQLEANAVALRNEFPGLVVTPIHGDYTAPIPLPPHTSARTVVFFPGSTIGNFEPRAAVEFLSRFAKLAGGDALLLLGADCNRDPEALLRAYDDSEGVTAQFDLNVLAHINRTHDATFDLDAFMHRAVWDAARSRIEMHLVSRRRQTVTIAGESIAFERGEIIVTEHCYKHAPETIRSLCADAGWHVEHTYTDAGDRMGLWLATTPSRG